LSIAPDEVETVRQRMAAHRSEDHRLRLEIAVAAAREAGDLTLGYFQSESLEAAAKADGTPVTIADREAERLIRRRLAERLPGDGVVGEEFGDERGDAARIWWVDPIDGTQAFARGVPLYGTMLGLEVEGDPALGVVYLPALGEIYFGARGAGAWWVPRLPRFEDDPTFPGGARRARVSTVRSLDQARFNTTSALGWRAAGRGDAYERLVLATAADRTWGDCYGHMLVATARADIMIDPIMQDWDCAALAPIIEEAGGRFTDVDGKATIHGKSAVSTNAILHDAVLRVLRG
jgi:histidinol phosphatase-like enzyme (inositol monophosphatase family)